MGTPDAQSTGKGGHSRVLQTLIRWPDGGGDRGAARALRALPGPFINTSGFKNIVQGLSVKELKIAS